MFFVMNLLGRQKLGKLKDLGFLLLPPLGLKLLHSRDHPKCTETN